MIKKSLVMGFTTGVLMLIGLVVQHFLAKYLTLDEYGVYVLMFSWIGLLSVFSLNSFNTIVTKASAQNYPRFFKTASKVCFLFSLLSSIALLIIGFFFEPERLNLFIVLAIFFPFYGGINLADSYFIGASKFNKYSIYMITSQCIIAGLQILSVVFLHGIFWLLFFTLLGTSVINLVMTFFIYRGIKQEKDYKKEQELTKYGIQLTGVGIFSSIASRIQYVLLASLAGTATLAIYAVAQLIPEKIKGLIKGVLNPPSMHLASQKKEESIYLMRKLILPLLLFGIGVGLLVSLFLPIIINLVFGQKYHEAIIYSLVLLVPVIFIPINAMFSSIIIYHDYKRFYTKITIITNILQIILFIVLIPLFQIWGVILAIVGLAVINTLLNLVWFYRLPIYPNKKTILTMRKGLKVKGYETIYFDEKLNGENILKVIGADYLFCKEKYPIWTRIIGKLSNIKNI
ncbi:MAG: oligosaccharide flippase family protein [Candidatus Nanoarchaeia archaeon]|nr:oligosaccharide flippase family protein [Candidatus Nanoarchaeia archaeon]